MPPSEVLGHDSPQRHPTIGSVPQIYELDLLHVQRHQSPMGVPINLVCLNLPYDHATWIIGHSFLQ